MISKVFIFACLVATGYGFAVHSPHCKVETQDIESNVCHLEATKVCGVEEGGVITYQGIGPDQVCADVVDKFCVPALVAADGCKEVTRKVCVHSHKVVDSPTPKLPAFYANDFFCRFVPKAVCKAQVALKAPKTVCEPLEAKLYFYGK
jgi:hypothetical protein